MAHTGKGRRRSKADAKENSLRRGARVPLSLWAGVDPWAAAGALLVAAGLAAAGLSVYLAASRSAPADAFRPWVFALTVLPIGSNFGVRDPMHLRRPRLDLALAAVLAILALAAVLRLTDSSLPSSAAPRSLFPFSGLLGRDPRRLQGASAAVGLLSLLLFHLTARRLVPVRIATVATFLAAISTWRLPVGIAGLDGALVAAAPLLLFYLLLRAIDSLRPIEFLLAGFAAGLCLSVPFAWPAPALACVFLLYRAVAEPGFLKLRWRGLLLAALGALVFLAPTVAYQALRPY